mgnify:CR=1 FL=1
MKFFDNSFKLIALCIAVFTVVGCADESATEKSKEIEQLEAEVSELKAQFVKLNRNQKAIAEHIGLAGKPKQPKLVLEDSAIIGNKDAKVALVEFTDLHCPFCKKFHDETLPLIKEKYIDTNQVLFVGKHFPIPSLHPNAGQASILLECARKEVDYSTAKAWLFNKGRALNGDSVDELVAELSLSKEEFMDCLAASETSAAINQDIALAKSIGIKSTPSFAVGTIENGEVVNWKTFSGAKSIEQFSEAIDIYLQ